jgi:Ser/Thr protein kinase RdoA (MazF antagonist)
MNDKINKIVKEFAFEGDLIEIKENQQGNINSTYILTYQDKKYLLQKINSYVFKDPYALMRNIDLVTKHIERKLEGVKDSKHKTLKVIKTNSGENFYTFINETGEKEYYRAYEYVENSISYENFNNCKNAKEIAYNTGKCFGFFHKMLNDFPVDMLTETIEDFHNTKKRFDNLLTSIENNLSKRALEYPLEIVTLITKIKECSVIWNNLGKGIPLRVTHNDTKLNNVLFDKDTNEAIAVIDLDTVMPGTILFDVGDGIRSACSNSFEDETDISKIFLKLDLTKEYLKGYLEEMALYLEKEEVNYLGLSIKIMTYELALRFLTDYISGDIYFKIKYKEHNRDRFLNQYALLNDIELKLEEINNFIELTYKEIKKETKY